MLCRCPSSWLGSLLWRRTKAAEPLPVLSREFEQAGCYIMTIDASLCRSSTCKQLICSKSLKSRHDSCLQQAPMTRDPKRKFARRQRRRLLLRGFEQCGSYMTIIDAAIVAIVILYHPHSSNSLKSEHDSFKIL